MQLLKLPEYEPRIQADEIFCLVRRKWISLTPEEWVRQNFLNLLIEHLSYPRGMIKLEHSMHYFKNMKRSDITVLDREGEVFLLVECKSHKVKLSQKTVSQLSQYNKVLNSKYLAISNGLKHFIWKKGERDFEQIDVFPSFR
ncbi:MAG: type I restriction enzyme HsdR N-terminal domain-containing protein [Cyclobacteriaceae bacterium]